MTRVKPFILSLLLLLAQQSSAHQAKQGVIHIATGPYFYRTNFSSIRGYGESPVLDGFGLLGQGDINQHGSLEVAIFYMRNLYKREFNDLYLLEEVKRIHISTGYRYWLTTDLSLAAGLFSAYSIGDTKVVHSQFNPPRSIDTSAQDVTEYGFDFSFQWEFWRKSKFAFLLDGRYALSVTAKDHEDGDQYGLMLAVKYLVQESSIPPSGKAKK
ncbi:MAG: hypothetical protein AB7N80_08735 [Bdellovibrionales bacterium]